MHATAHKVLNLASYQLCWFACVLGAAHGDGFIGPLLLLPVLALHLYYARHWQVELRFVLLTGLIGSLFDQLLLSLHWVSYPSSSWPAGLLPLWMLALWLAFATTFNVSLRWLRPYPLAGTLLAALITPLLYHYAASVGAITLLQRPAVYLAIACGFALLVPLLLKLSGRLDGYL